MPTTKTATLRTRMALALIGAALAHLPLSGVHAAPPTATPEYRTDTRTSGDWWEPMRVGLRVGYTSLDDHSRIPEDSNADGMISADEVLAVSYMGSITELDAEQWYLPTDLYVQWELSPYWGLELGWDHLKAKTSTYWDGHSDGSFFLSGPHLGLYAAYANRTRFTPYVQAGIVYYSARFNPEEQWTVLMDDEVYAEWLAAGSPETWFDGRQQRLEADDAYGTFMMAGCEIALTETLSLEAFFKCVEMEVYAHWQNSQLFFDEAHPNGERRDTLDNGFFRYPASTTLIGLGIQYRF
ncbi:MAG: hypothetical protein HQ523_04035 [Lentisphaerae bacterium]|nr:hypothetical protein [Lentisphaerota bacterium]